MTAATFTLVVTDLVMRRQSSINPIENILHGEVYE